MSIWRNLRRIDLSAHNHFLHPPAISDIKAHFSGPEPVKMASEFHTNFKPYVPKKRTQYMSPNQLEDFRKILNQLKNEMSQDIDSTVHTMQDAATVSADPND